MTEPMTFRWMPEARALWERWKYFNAAGHHAEPMTLKDLLTFNELARRLDAFAEQEVTTDGSRTG